MGVCDVKLVVKRYEQQEGREYEDEELYVPVANFVFH